MEAKAGSERDPVRTQIENHSSLTECENEAALGRPSKGIATHHHMHVTRPKISTCRRGQRMPRTPALSTMDASEMCMCESSCGVCRVASASK